jgi:hypothetical protein
MISRALHLNVFEQPVKKDFFNNLIVIDRAFEKQKARALTSLL